MYIIAGEASGDLHGGNLIRELRKLGPDMEIRAWGGDRMAAAGAEVVMHYRDLAFMGFAEVVSNLRTILRNLKRCKEDIRRFHPDVVVLIDYPGFNLRIASYVHELGIPVHWYISPQLWAWKKGRVHTLKQVVDRMYVILPFEKNWYAGYGMEVEFVGHPLLDAIEQEGSTELEPLPGDDGRPVVAILPGSRMQEISRMLPLMAGTAQHFPEYRFVVAAAPSVPPEAYSELVGDAPVSVISGRTYDVLRSARAALVTSGTATLEAALFGVPEVVCYKGSSLNVWLARRLVRVKFISLVNLIMDREVVRELVQDDLTATTLRKELARIVTDGEARSTMVTDLAELRERSGGPGASKLVANGLWKSLHEGS